MVLPAEAENDEGGGGGFGGRRVREEKMGSLVPF